MGLAFRAGAADARSGVSAISEGSYRPDIEGLRAVAVLSVVFYHLGFPLHGGFVGVDIFFVISGFLISTRIITSIEAGSFSFRQFYLARLRRIMPAMIVTTLLSLVAAAVLMSPGVLQDLGGSAIAATASVSNIYFWLDTGYFTADSSSKALLHTWSLGVEEQFYLIWPLLLVGVGALNHRAMPVAIIVVSAMSLVATEVLLGVSESAAFFLMPFRICEFGIGAVLVWPARALRMPRVMSEAGVAIGMAVMVAAIVLIDGTMRFPGVLAMVPCVGAALVITFGAESRLGGAVLANLPAVWIGRVSYSLYLVHWPLVVLAEYALQRDLDINEAIVGFVACLALATALYVLVERPFRRKRFGVFLVKPTVLLAIVSALAAVTVVASWSASSTGWTWRLGGRASTFDGISDPRQFHVKYYGGAACGLPRCETNPGVAKVAYLVGDSHARAYFAGLKAAFPDVNFVIYGPNSCPMYTATMSHDDDHAEACLKARELAFHELAGATGPVFLAQHWAAEMNYTLRVAAGDPPIHFKDNVAGFTTFVAGQMQDVERLIGKPIFLIGGIPRYGGVSSPFDCVSRPFQPETCNTSAKAGFVAAQEAITAAFRSDGIPMIDPYDVLCDQTTCRDTDDAGRSLYSDRTHLSIWGSEYLVGRLGPDIAAHLQ